MLIPTSPNILRLYFLRVLCIVYNIARTHKVYSFFLNIYCSTVDCDKGKQQKTWRGRMTSLWNRPASIDSSMRSFPFRCRRCVLDIQIRQRWASAATFPTHLRFRTDQCCMTIGRTASALHWRHNPTHIAFLSSTEMILTLFAATHECFSTQLRERRKNNGRHVSCFQSGCYKPDIVNEPPTKKKTHTHTHKKKKNSKYVPPNAAIAWVGQKMLRRIAQQCLQRLGGVRIRWYVALALHFDHRQMLCVACGRAQIKCGQR